ncbi:MAG: bifunctional demethylmenaquinone methyltransferase/2-methoxy-6-polyprenyl-1,4-benzoquinol methylase UbiE [Candidatus Caenarcaniphilales bacterium]|nr:bifunctional demethylmenaquinone methyltransferase/2-methoxy-6-polyprenyl-1,4-benzoquinol methylase UbiE [Candidatus Caenarcaniphilales bacterium]
MVNSEVNFHKKKDNSTYVHAMFNDIAYKYDLMNDLMTFGLHRLWKQKVSKLLNVPNKGIVLDLCCGTGDLTSIIVKQFPESEVIGIDFSEQMLEIADKRRKKSNVKFIKGDISNLPFEDESIDGISISFGLRNVSNYRKCLKEIFRISKPNSRFVILDLSHPKGLWDLLSKIYRFRIVPIIGNLIVGNKSAYEYLPNSIANYPNQEELCVMLKDSGWNEIEYFNIFGGVSAIHVAAKIK